MLCRKLSDPVSVSRMTCATISEAGMAKNAWIDVFFSVAGDNKRIYANAAGIMRSAENCFVRNNESIAFPSVQVSPASAKRAIPLIANKSSSALNSLSFLRTKGFKTSQNRHVIQGRNNNTVAIIFYQK